MDDLQMELISTLKRFVCVFFFFGDSETVHCQRRVGNFLLGLEIKRSCSRYSRMLIQK